LIKTLFPHFIQQLKRKKRNKTKNPKHTLQLQEIGKLTMSLEVNLPLFFHCLDQQWAGPEGNQQNQQLFCQQTGILLLLCLYYVTFPSRAKNFKGQAPIEQAIIMTSEEMTRLLLDIHEIITQSQKIQT
jgi:hypothetical protein